MTSEVGMGSVGRGVARRGTGEVASMRAGLRMMGRVMGARPPAVGRPRAARSVGAEPEVEAHLG